MPDRDLRARTLGSVLEDGQIPVADRIALSDAGLRKLVAVAIVLAFLVVNGAVLWGIWIVFQKDIELLTAVGSKFAASDRIVTTNLLMALVGATTVQLGALIVLIGKYLFPAPRG
jgi:hypothetical protein